MVGIFKGTVTLDILPQIFFTSPKPLKIIFRVISKVLAKFAEIFSNQGATPLSTMPVANLPTVSTTPAAKFATGVIYTGGKCYLC
jgi:hypothetical protein